MRRVVANVILLIALLPSMLWAQFDTTLSGSITAARIQHDAKHASSVLNASPANASDAEDVDQWLDSTGNGTHATAQAADERPVLDADGFRGLPCVQGRAGDLLAYSDQTWSKNLPGFTWVFAFKNVDTGSAQALANAYSTTDRLYPLLDPTGDNRLYFVLKNPDATDNSQYPSTATLTNSTDHFLIVQANLTSSSFKIWRDGTNTTTATLSGTSNTSNTNTTDAVILAADPFKTNTFRGCMAHIIFYPYALSDAQVGSLQTALETYWDASPPTPTPTPTPTAAPVRLRMLMGIGQ